MQISQKMWTKAGWKDMDGAPTVGDKAHLVFAFGGSAEIKQAIIYQELAKFYPSAHIILCSTAGEILGTNVTDQTVVVTAIAFKNTTIKALKTKIHAAVDSFAAGEQLAHDLPIERLAHVMVFSEGLIINGTQLLSGLSSKLPKTVSITGGLVGDGANFKETVAGLDSVPESGTIVIVGFYGDSLRVGYGSLGGWDPFGIERTITKSEGNVLYELDGKPALALYKEYLGDQAKGLPGSALLFPLSLRLSTPTGEKNVVRTVLSVDEAAQSMTFAGDLPQGTPAQLMKANFDRLVDGAGGAASMSIESIGSGSAELAVLISCVGRKLVLKERVEEEIEAVQEVVGKQAAITGFYSYGELCPTAPKEKQCQLHNQTMTITTMREL